MMYKLMGFLMARTIDLKDVVMVMKHLNVSFNDACNHVKKFGNSLGELEKAAREIREKKKTSYQLQETQCSEATLNISSGSSDGRALG